MITLDSVLGEVANFFGIQEPQEYDFGLTQLQQRNEARLQEAIEQLGDKWLLHPTNVINKSERNE